MLATTQHIMEIEKDQAGSGEQDPTPALTSHTIEKGWRDMATYDFSDFPGIECIYFVQMHPDGPVKIGRETGYLVTRLNSLRSASPYNLRVLGVIPLVHRQVETMIHQVFKADRLRGEWFRPSAELMTFIAESARPWTGRQPPLDGIPWDPKVPLISGGPETHVSDPDTEPYN